MSNPHRPETADADLMVIGHVTGVHGLAGNLKIRSFAESTDIFAPGNVLVLRHTTPGNLAVDRRHRQDDRLCVIDAGTPGKKGMRIRLSGVDNRTTAEALVGCHVLIRREQLPTLEADTWYWRDLIGLTVIDHERGNLGVVKTLIETGANDVLVIEGPARELLVPMHRHFVSAVAPTDGTLFTRLPTGYEQSF